ncbi:MAG: DNA polymerase III subunit gamma/tau [Polyangiaceae bacterium]|nr:DNA polymerase III subunit gamma/tau [Polyangiaceae bacterium]MCW5791933.1 DNA polymerase III subunit gamma/tau [Polyangiaceae bacterium]
MRQAAVSQVAVRIPPPYQPRRRRASTAAWGSKADLLRPLSMSYVVLARKYRPMTFTDLVGQDHVARILAGAIASGRLAHAFLFTGVRGVGKTTSARILAKALNCLGDPSSHAPGGPDPGPTSSPCLKCAACLEITDGKDVDVLEIDGASNASVDDVRRLQDSLPYRPQRDRYKVVIVDEVHMLSGGAWNALLKTVEEPPPHVKFIFATTEVHKVPATILSRVQRFDFKLIGAQQISQRLRQVLELEQIRAEEGALHIIAREAAGSMRDAMSLLDQVIAFGEDLTTDRVAEVLGVASHEALRQIASALLTGDAASCLERVHGLAERGHNVTHVARDLLSLLRDLVVAKLVADPAPLVQLTADELKELAALAASAETDDLLRLHLGFSRGFDEVARGSQPRAALEMLLLRLARRPPLTPVDDLIARLQGLERRLAGARAAPNGREPGGREPSGREPSGREPGGREPSGREPPPADRQPPARPQPRESAPAAQAPSEPAEEPPAAAPSPPRAAPSPASPPEIASLAPASAPAAPDAGGAADGDEALDRVRPADEPHPHEPVRSTDEPRPHQPVRSTDEPHPHEPIRSTDEPRSVRPSAPPSVRPSAPPSTRPSAPPSVRPSAPPSARPSAPPSRPSGNPEDTYLLARAAAIGPPSAEHRARLEAWAKLLTPLRAERPDLAAKLNHALLLEFSAEEVALGFDRHDVFRGQTDSQEARAAILQHATAHFGAEPKLRYEFDLPDAQVHTLATLEAERREAERLAAIERAKNHPLVLAAERLLGARVKRIAPYE